MNCSAINIVCRIPYQGIQEKGKDRNVRTKIISFVCISVMYLISKYHSRMSIVWRYSSSRIARKDIFSKSGLIKPNFRL